MKKIILLTLIIVLLVAGGAFFYIESKPSKLSAEEKDRAYSKILGREVDLSPETATGDTKYNGKYASFIYPASAKIYKYIDPDSKKNAYTKERFSFDVKNPKLVLNYTAEDNQGAVGKLSDYPAVKLRQDKSFGYTETEVTSDGVKGLGFTKDVGSENDAEASAFFLRNGMIYSISITGNNLMDVTDLFKKITGSLTFL
jgi:hypothetical protein